MARFLQLSIWVRIPILLVLLVLSVACLFVAQNVEFSQYVEGFGFAGLLLSLVLLFETFGLSLFYKIIIALVLGIFFSATQYISGDQFLVLKPIGSKIFLNLLTLALVPLVFSSILTGVTHLADISKLRRIGLKAIVYFISTTVVAVTIGLIVSNIFQPGRGMSQETRTLFESQMASAEKVDTTKKVGFDEVIQNLVPKNILTTASQPRPDMLALILFAVLCGIALLQIGPEKSATVVSFFEGINEMTIQIITMVMRIAPYGVFAIIGATLSQSQGFELIYALIPFSAVVVGALLIHALLINYVSLTYLSKRPVLGTFLAVKEVLITAFSTASSGATMPFTMKVVEQELKVKKEVSSFVVSLGATINMDGSSLFQGVSAIFLANLYGIDLGLFDQVTIVVMAVLASIGTAAVPGVSIVMLMMILATVGIPSEGILFLLPVNHILDMCRTSVNVLGDICCALYINKVEGES